MKMPRFNWPAWAGFLLSLFAFLSYPLIFVRWPITRDFPWAGLALFAVAAGLLFFGVRSAFSGNRPRRSKIGGAVLATLSVLVFSLFIFSAFIMARWMPAAKGAPQIGQKAPDFSLADTNGKPVTLAELLSTPIKPGSANPKGVLLVFYRGYW